MHLDLFFTTCRYCMYCYFSLRVYLLLPRATAKELDCKYLQVAWRRSFSIMSTHLE